MPDHEDKKYDVAISLRWTDVEHARALYELLRDRLDVFFADEKQEDFVGTDGEESFGYIFRDQARIVVVLYRPDWGTTPFTRAEEAAIKQRAWKEGYGFSIWVPMDEAKSVPPYLPPQHVWFDFEQYGVKGLASVVEERVRESGREVRPETTADRLRKIKRRMDLEQKRQKFENSQEGVDFVSDLSRKLEDLIEAQVEEYKEVDSKITFEIEHSRGRFTVTSSPYRCIFVLDPYATNSIREASLTVYLGRRSGSHSYQSDWQNVGQHSFKPTLDDDGKPSWRLKNGQHHSAEAAVAHVLDNMAERVYLAVEKRTARR